MKKVLDVIVDILILIAFAWLVMENAGLVPGFVFK